MSKTAIEFIANWMMSAPTKAWSVKELAKSLPLPKHTISSALSANAQMTLSPVRRVGYGKYQLRLELLMPDVVDSDPVFDYEVQYVTGRAFNEVDGKIMIKARNVVEAGIIATRKLRELSEFHIYSITQED